MPAMPDTTDQGLEFLTAADAPDIAAGLEALAQSVDLRLVRVFADAADRAARWPTPAGGNLSVRLDAPLVVEAWDPVDQAWAPITASPAEQVATTIDSAASPQAAGAAGTLLTAQVTLASPANVFITGSSDLSAGGNAVADVTLYVDGVLARRRVWDSNGAAKSSDVSVSRWMYLSAGAHTIDLRFSVGLGSNTVTFKRKHLDVDAAELPA